MAVKTYRFAGRAARVLAGEGFRGVTQLVVFGVFRNAGLRKRAIQARPVSHVAMNPESQFEHSPFGFHSSSWLSPLL